MRTVLTTALVAMFASVLVHAQAAVCKEASKSFGQHRWAESAQAFAQCEELSPGQTQALLYRAKALVNVGSLDSATSSLDAFLAGHPDSEDALYLLAYVQLRQNQPKESLESCTRAAKTKEPQAIDLKTAGIDHFLLNDYQNAARNLEQSLKENPADIETRYYLGRVSYAQNQIDQALATFQEVLRRDPKNAQAQNDLGLCFASKNRNEAALVAFRKAVALDSAAAAHSEQPYLNYGKLLTDVSHPKEALTMLSRALKIQPASATTHYELGRALFQLERFQDASGHLEEAIRLDPKNSASHYLLGKIYRRLGQEQEAAEQFKTTDQLVQQEKKQTGGVGTSR